MSHPNRANSQEGVDLHVCPAQNVCVAQGAMLCSVKMLKQTGRGWVKRGACYLISAKRVCDGSGGGWEFG